METAVDIAYSHARENLAAQRAALDNLRTRSAAVITAAAVISSFLGGQALADTKSVPGVSAPVADRTLQPWEVVGFGAFLILLLISGWIIKPKTKGWKFQLDAKWLLADADAKKAATPSADSESISQQQKRELAEHMENYYTVNGQKIEKLFTLLELSVVLLAVEAAGFMLDLTT